MFGDDEIPAAVCPDTGDRIIMPAGMWNRHGLVEVFCPSCGHTHAWDAKSKQLLPAPSPPQRSDSTEPRA